MKPSYTTLYCHSQCIVFPQWWQFLQTKLEQQKQDIRNVEPIDDESIQSLQIVFDTPPQKNSQTASMWLFNFWIFEENSPVNVNSLGGWL